MTDRYIVLLLALMASTGSISGQNLDNYIRELVKPGPYSSVSIYSLQGYKPLSYIGSHSSTYFSYVEVDRINKAFIFRDDNKIKLTDVVYTKTSLTNRRFLNYLQAVHDSGNTILHLYCGKTNKIIICGKYPLRPKDNTKERNQEIRELLNQTVNDLVAAGY